MHQGSEFPYEFHVTVQTPDIIGFKKACVEIGVKPIILSLQNQNTEEVMQDVMTSSKFSGNIDKTYEELNKIRFGLEDRGFKVVRMKMKSIPWHPLAPQKEGEYMPANLYFESHIAVKIPLHSKINDLYFLKILAIANDAHMSRNAFKTYENGSIIQMLTLRSTDHATAFKALVDKFVNELKLYRFDVDKTIIEFALYDTNVQHDKEWIEV